MILWILLQVPENGYETGPSKARPNENDNMTTSTKFWEFGVSIDTKAITCIGILGHHASAYSVENVPEST